MVICDLFASWQINNRTDHHENAQLIKEFFRKFTLNHDTSSSHPQKKDKNLLLFFTEIVCYPFRR